MTSSSIINRENSENKCEEDEEKDSKDEENDDDSTKFSHYKEKVGNWKGCLCSFVSNTSDLVDLFRSTKEKEMKRIQREKDQFSSENAHEIGKSSKSYNTSEDPENPAASKQKKKKKKKRGLLEALSSNLSEAKESHIEECSKPEKLTAKAAEEGIREESNSNEDDEMDENKDIVEVFGYKLKRKDIMTEIPSVTHSPLPQICQPQADPRSQVIIAFASQCSPPFVDVRAASASLPDFHQTSSAHPHDSLLASPLGPLSTCPQFLLSVLTFPLIIVQSDKNPFPSVSLLSLSGNGRWVAAAFDDSPYFMLFDTVALTSFVLQRGKYPASILSICFGEHDGMYFAAQTLKGTVHIWKKIKTTFRLSTQNEVDGMDNEQEEHERETHDTKAKEEHSIDYTTSDREIEAIEEMKEREKIKNCDVEYWPTGKTSRHCRAKKLKKSAIAFTSDASKLILCQVPEDGLASVRQFRMADEEADLSCVQENNLWRYPLPPSK
ncbi:Autophagy-related protein 18 G (Atg18G) [Monocercomonoides exilis]|uniref:Autophagy-related protein 18 G (Atg18G) n=1 Tax=Monocercomonoides exilis TaxID=2049356 RepID=UPI00355A3865|nr:Autophagy-related protein 18 G (Atg18G) [Monocercomonoides exilis]|eukprot:MONOS_4743.1-p1 / transcript=MONOS_4743.1 / gene=MONOS_4743 / organism=Monocercomonoides_exilis_PA203 / gene_product=Autophagy-related protein 18 G (Atg18G) / transcript_product=Autophagy-related protein 18 G (Atg18G) / location=Mono_scaffold00130:53762-55518(-) / protein_length=494 / sequence_SO=supercontig / SO=protein_coding / is_pseudo=false